MAPKLARKLLNLLLPNNIYTSDPHHRLPPSPPRHRYRHAVTDNQARSRVAAPTQCRRPNCDPPKLQQIRDHGCGLIARRAGERPPGKSSPATVGRHVPLVGPMTDCAQEDDKPFEIRLSDEAFETYELDPPPYTLDVTKKELKQMYYDMVAVRYGSPRSRA